MITRRHGLLALAALSLAPARLFAQTPSAFRLQNGKVMTEVRVGGVAVQAMLDSGGALNAIDSRVASAMGLLPVGQAVTLEGVGGTVRGRYSAPIDLILGGRTLSGTRLAIVDLSGLGGGTGVDMIVGAPLFRSFAVDFNFVESSFLLGEPARAPADRTMVTLTQQGEWMTAPLQIGDEVVRATVDIGSEAAVLLSPDTARRLRIGSRGAVTAVIGGVGGRRVGRIVTVPSIGFAGQTFSDVPVQIAPRDLGTEANVGLDLLSRFHLWFDVGSRRLLVRSNGRTGPFPRNLVGFYAERENDSLRITHVVAGSPAEKAGLRQGDVIAAIDGVPAVRANQGLTNAPPGRVLTLTLANGRERSLTLAPYY